MTNYFRKPDALVDAVKAVLSGQPVQEKMDPVDQKALKGKHSDRKDKDIDNDGDVDSSDEYLHKRRKAVSKAMKEEVELDEKVAAYDKNGKVVGLYRNMADAKRLKPNHTYKIHKEEVELDEKVAAYDKNGKVVGLYRNMADAKRLKPNHTYKIHKEETEDNPANTQHLCAKNVVHESWGEGSCIPTMHADPDEDGNIEWYDVMFDHGIEEQVSIEELKVTKAESHMHSSKKKIEESEDEDEDDMEDDGDDSDEDEKNGKKKKTSGKKDDVDVEPEMDDQQMTSEMSDKQMKKREEIVLSMKKKMPDFKKKYGDRAKDVMYATATKMAMREGFELGIEKSDLIEEVELHEAKSGTGYDLYHKDFSSAMQHAYDHAKKKHGITINPSEIDNKVASGPRKPSEGKTNTYRLKGDKGAIQVQVYNKGGSKPFELNMYKEEVELDEAISVSSAYALVIQQKDGSREIVAKGSKEKMKTAAKKYGGLKQGKVFISLTGKKVGDKILGIGEEVELDEAKSGTGYDLYHKDFSSAMQHAYDHAKKKHGITINPSEIDNKVASGPRKPSEGKTNTYRLKGDKGAIQVQVYNKGGSKPFELNMYKEETELDEAKSATGKILVADPKTQKVTKIDEKDWPKYEKKGYVQAESNDLDEGFINIGGAKVKDDEKSILQHIKKTFPNVNKVKKDPQHGWIPVFEELDLDEANVAKMSDDVLKSRLAQMKRAENSPAIQFEIKRLKKEMKKRNIQEESDLDEARGRPRKDGTTGGSEDRENIQMQLRKSVSLRGLKDVEFADGKKVKVSARDAQSILSKLDAIKAPKERQNAVIHIAKSHNNLVDFASGKSGEMDPEKRKVAFLKGLMKTK
jgi:predicted small metal-binding protein